MTLDFTRTSNLQNYSVRKFQLQLDMDLEGLTTEDIVDAVATAAPTGMRQATWKDLMSNRNDSSASRKVVLRGGYTALIVGFLIAGVYPAPRRAECPGGHSSARIGHRGTPCQAAPPARHQKDRQRTDAGDGDARPALAAEQDLGTFLRDLTTQFGESGMKDIAYKNLPATPLGHSRKLPIELRGRGTYARFHDSSCVLSICRGSARWGR